jgi:hypothetical protein
MSSLVTVFGCESTAFLEDLQQQTAVERISMKANLGDDVRTHISECKISNEKPRTIDSFQLIRHGTCWYRYDKDNQLRYK